MPEMKTILVGSTDSAISVLESLQEVEKRAKAAKAIAAPVATEFFRDGMRRLRIFMLVAIRVVFAMGELFIENESVSGLLWSCRLRLGTFDTIVLI